MYQIVFPVCTTYRSDCQTGRYGLIQLVKTFSASRVTLSPLHVNKVTRSSSKRSMHRPEDAPNVATLRSSRQMAGILVHAKVV